MSPKTKVNTERVNVFFAPDQMNLVKQEAQMQGLSVSAYIRMVTVREADASRFKRIMENSGDLFDKIKENGKMEQMLGAMKTIAESYTKGE